MLRDVGVDLLIDQRVGVDDIGRAFQDATHGGQIVLGREARALGVVVEAALDVVRLAQERQGASSIRDPIAGGGLGEFTDRGLGVRGRLAAAVGVGEPGRLAQSGLITLNDATWS